METSTLKRSGGRAVFIAIACVALALWSTSCGGGGGTTVVPVSTAGFSITPNTVTFPTPEAVGTPPPPSATLTATLVNVGNAALTISSVQVMGTNPGDFTVSTNPSPNCGASIAPSGTCTVSLTFAPTAAGTRTATLIFTDNASGSPQSLTVTGTGTAPAVSLSAPGVTFGNQLVGTPAPQQTVTVMNSGTGPLTINSIALTGANSSNFGETNNCPISPNTLAASIGTCTITVTFNPQLPGTFNSGAVITITDNDGGANPPTTQTISLTGTGTGPTANLTLTSNFPSAGTSVGTTSTAQVTLANNGNTNLTISAISVPAPFTIASAAAGTTCSTSSPVPGPGTCVVIVDFTPTTNVQASGTLTVTDNALNNPNSQQPLALSATGTGANPVVSLPPTGLSFGIQTVNIASGALSVTLTNTGNGPLNFSTTPPAPAPGAIYTTGPFSIQSTTCSTSNPVPQSGGTCTVFVTFTPTATGAAPAGSVLTFIDNNNGVANSTQTVSLTGSGTTSPLSLSGVSPSAPQNVGSAGTPQTITVTNTSGTLPLTVTGVTITGANSNDFTITTNNCTTVQPLQTCTFNVTFDPLAEGVGLTATVNVAATQGGVTLTPQTATLTGTGVGAVVQLSPTSLNFINQPLGTPGAYQLVTLTNIGNSPLTLTSLAPTDPTHFNLSTGTTCTVGTQVAAGATCNIGVTFTPTNTTSVTGTMVTIADNATNPTPSPQSIPLTGSATGAVVQLPSQSVTFSASVPVGTTTPPTQQLTIMNNGNTPLNINAPQLSGADTGDFTVTLGTCSSPVAAGGSCAMNVTFLPTAEGSNLTATLTITDNGTPSTSQVTLTGTGTAPVVSIPLAFTFPNSQNVSSTSNPQPITVTNTGNSNLTIASIGPLGGTNPGDFNIVSGTGQCSGGGTLAGGNATCTIWVTFTPSMPGSRSATLTVTDNTDNVSGSVQTVTLTGTGNGAQVAFIPPSVTFGSQTQGAASAPVMVTLQNAGNINMTLSGSPTVTITGANPSDYAISNSTCGSLLTPSSTCTFNVTFTPQTTGSLPATLSVNTNAPSPPQTANLMGTGVSGITFTPSSSVSFASQNVGSPQSASQTVTIKNSGTTNLIMGTLTNSDATDFPWSQTGCNGATLVPGAACTIMVAFKPTVPGSPLTAAITIPDNLNTSPQTVSLSGTAIGSTATFTSTTPNFPTPQSVNSPPYSTQAVATIMNNGNTLLNFTSIVSSNNTEFALATGANACPYTGGSLAVGASCTIYATFAPTSYGTRTSLVTIADNALNSPQSVNLSGTGNAPFASVSPLPPGIQFPNTAVGHASTPLNVTLTNAGNVTLTVSGQTSTDTTDFLTPSCVGSVAANNGTCVVAITFTPSTPGLLSATLTFTDNSNDASGSTQMVTLRGTGTGAVAVPSPAPLQFGTVTILTPVTVQLMVSNTTGNQPLSITGLGPMTGTNLTDFSASLSGSTCLNPVPAGGSCTFGVTFTPKTATTENASFTILDTAFPGTQTENVIGTGTGSAVGLSPSPLAFPAQAVTSPATFGTAQAITLTNTGNPLTITAIQVNGGTNPGDFQVVSGAGSCPLNTPIATSCTIWVEFGPTASGTRSAILNVTDNASTGGGTQSANLTGTGTVGSVQLTANSLSFGSYAVGSNSQGACTPAASPTNCVTMTNTGSAVLNITNITIGGTNPSDFAVYAPDTTCPVLGGTLNQNASCIVDVTFQPQASGNNLSATLIFNDSATTTPQTVNLTGTGTAPNASLSPTTWPFANTYGGTPSSPETFVLSNTGNAPLNIASIAITDTSLTNPSGVDFTQTTTCGTIPGTLPAPVPPATSTTCNIVVTFMPAFSGSRSANLVVTDNSLGVNGTPQTSGLTGTGLHDVVLTWNASPTAGVLLYDIFRGTSAGGEGTTPYATATAATSCTTTAPITCTYVDTAVTPSDTYYYDLTAVASNGITQSAVSNEAHATVPSP